MRMGKRLTITVVVLSALAALAAALAFSDRSHEWFAPHALPVTTSHRLFDIGIVDADGDGVLDIYSSNHHFRQLLLIGDGHGGYRDVLSDWGLDQSREFPLAELSFVPPRIERAGVYIYWLGTQLIVRAHGTAEIGSWSGRLSVDSAVDVIMNEIFHIEHGAGPEGEPETVIAFAPEGDGKLVLRPNGQGLPIDFELDGGVLPDQIHVGRGAVSPRSGRFSLAMRDRHALAWSDVSGDGRPDVFANRGALGGSLRAQSEAVQRGINDELLVRARGSERFEDVAASVGIAKRGCSGRHARWVDFDRSGRLDLFVNCQDRGNVDGRYPKQLYRQDADGRFTDVAVESGLALAEHELIDFAWLDVDNDGYPELLTSEATGFYLYRNDGGHFSREFIGRGAFVRQDDPDLLGTTNLAWYVDGKLVVTDFDGDGALDAFSASRKGNMLLRNDGGRFVLVEPQSVGLPQASLTARWVDFDNDGRADLHAVPQGLFRQREDGRFEPTRMLELPADERYRAAIVNWFDIDNDGRLDMLIALSLTPDFKHWWQLEAPRRSRDEWEVRAYRNIGAGNHWLQLELSGVPGNREGIGARVTVVTPDGERTQEVGHADGAFFSQGHYRLYFGLGRHDRAEHVRIRWPDGHTQQLDDVEAGRLLRVERNGQSRGQR